MQRGLRANKGNQMLWREYFKLELTIYQRILERRRTLGLDELDHKKESQGSFEEDDQNPFLAAEIPKVVFESAMEDVPPTLDFCLQFLEILEEFEEPLLDSIQEFLRTKILELFPENPSAFVSVVTRDFTNTIYFYKQTDETKDEIVDSICSRLEARLGSSGDDLDQRCLFLVEASKLHQKLQSKYTSASNPTLIQNFGQRLIETYSSLVKPLETASVSTITLLANGMSELYPEQTLNLLESLLECVSDAGLFMIYSDLKLKLSPNSEDCRDMLEEGLDKFKKYPETLSDLYQRILEIVYLQFVESVVPYEQLKFWFKRAIKDLVKVPALQSIVILEYLRIAAFVGETELSECWGQISKLSGKPSQEAYRLVVRYRQMQGSSSSDVYKFFEMALNQYPKEQNFWIDYLVYAKSNGDFTTCNATLQRACGHFPGDNSLRLKLTSIIQG